MSSKQLAGRPAVFLDRDGVLNELVLRDGKVVSPRSVDDFHLRPGVDEALRQLRRRGLPVFVVTNQPDVARGHLALRTLQSMTEILRTSLDVDDVSVCPHDDSDGCECRKPKPGMLLALAKRCNIDLTRSYMIGDSWKDVEAGRRAGCRTILLAGGDSGAILADCAVATLHDAVMHIESER